MSNQLLQRACLDFPLNSLNVRFSHQMHFTSCLVSRLNPLVNVILLETSFESEARDMMLLRFQFLFNFPETIVNPKLLLPTRQATTPSLVGNHPASSFTMKLQPIPFAGGSQVCVVTNPVSSLLQTCSKSAAPALCFVTLVLQSRNTTSSGELG